jgi:hypothetical protein
MEERIMTHHPINGREWGLAVRTVVCLALWAAGTVLPGAAKAQTPPDAGLVMSVSGETRYGAPGETTGPEPVQAFMKVRKGDRIFLSDNGRIDLLFLENGRRETWTGPARLTLTASGALSEDPDATPEATEVKAPVFTAIKGSGLPLPRGQIARGGVSVVRGLFDECPEAAPEPRPVPTLGEADRAELASARAVYEDLRRQTPAGDPLPDLYYLSVLARYERFGEMDRIIDRLHRIHGDIPALEKWDAWVRENHPVRVSFFMLKPDEGCRQGPACFGLGDMGYFRKSGPCPVSELDQRDIRTGDILTFALANTSDIVYYAYIVNVDPSGNADILFPESFGDPYAARLAPRKVLDLFRDAGIGLMSAEPGRETIRVYLSAEPLKEADRERLKSGPTDDLTAIEASVYISKRRS